MRYSQPLSVALALAGLAAGHARADVIYSTFGPGDSYDSAAGQQLVYEQIVSIIDFVAVSFVPSTTGSLDQVTVALEAPDEPYTVNVTSNLDWTFAGGTDGPGPALETFNATGDSAPQLLTFSSVLHPVLTAGTKYWVEVQTTPAWNTNGMGVGTWFNNDQNITGEVSKYTMFCEFLCAPTTTDTIAPAVEVTGFAVPEPGMLVPVLIAGLAIGLGTLKRNAPSESHSDRLLRYS
jgi:hypothetical protein